MLTLCFFNTEQIQGVNTTLANLSFERGIANFHPAPTPAPTLDLQLGASFGAVDMGRFQLGQLLAQLQLADLGELFGPGGAIGETWLLADLGWQTANAPTTETARIFRQVNYVSGGFAESQARLDFTITTTATGARVVNERPILTRGDTIEVVSDAAAGNNFLRMSLEQVDEECCLVKALVPPNVSVVVNTGP